jgi:drug/metabolite transporter (DMT)-like permease
MNTGIAIIFALLTAIMWGLGPVLFKKAYSKVSSYFSYSFDGLTGGTLLMVPFAVMGGVEWSKLGQAIVFTLPYSITYLMYLRAFDFKESKTGVVSAVLQTYPVFTLLGAYALHIDRLNPNQYLTIMIIIFATTILALSEEGAQIKDIFKNTKQKWFLFSFLTSILMGLGDIVLDKGIDYYNPFTSIIAIYITQLFIIMFLLLLRSKETIKEFKETIKTKSLALSLFLASVFMTLGAITFYLAFEYGPASLVSPIAGISPVFTVIAAAIILKEKITKIEFTLIGVILTYLAILTV